MRVQADCASALAILRQIGAELVLYRDYKKWSPDWKRAGAAERAYHLALTDTRLTGVGYRCGSADLRDFDLDGCKTLKPLAAVLAALGLPEQYEWVIRTASGKGFRVVIRCKDEAALVERLGSADVIRGTAKGAELDHLELRWAHQSALAGQAFNRAGHLGRYAFLNAIPTQAPAYVCADRVVAAFLAVAHLEAGRNGDEHHTPLSAFSGESSEQTWLLFHLAYISPACERHTWLAVAGVIKDLFGEAGFDIWNAWSRGCEEKYDASEMARTWRSLRGKTRATTKTITYLANRDSNKQAARDWFARCAGSNASGPGERRP